MKEFPQSITPKNQSNFSEIYKNRVLAYLRRDIYEFILADRNNDYFEIDKFSRKYFTQNFSSHNAEFSDIISKELSNMGWKCKLAYGGTGLFIYSGDPPPMCF